MTDSTLYARTDSVGAGAPGNEIEVTRSMMEAGVEAIAEIDWEMDRFEEMAVAIYVAMASTKLLATDDALHQHTE